MTVETTRLCEWRVTGGMFCSEPAVVTSLFTMDGYGPDGRFTSLWARVKGLTCGHSYQEEVANLASVDEEDAARLKRLDDLKAKRTPGKYGHGTMPCIMCGEPVPQRLASDENEGAGKYCGRCK